MDVPNVITFSRMKLGALIPQNQVELLNLHFTMRNFCLENLMKYILTMILSFYDSFSFMMHKTKLSVLFPFRTHAKVI